MSSGLKRNVVTTLPTTLAEGHEVYYYSNDVYYKYVGNSSNEAVLLTNNLSDAEKSALADIGQGASLADDDDTLATQKQVKDYVSGRVVNVSDYGATGDGSTNDTQAFHDAIDALPAGGGTIFVPDGTYVVAIRVQKENVRIVGESWNTILTIQDNATQGETDCPLRILSDYCQVSNLHIDGNYDNNATLTSSSANARIADGIAIYANYCTVDNVSTRKVIGHHIIVWNDSFTAESHPSGARHHNVVRNCYIRETGVRNALDFASTEDVGVGSGYDQKINYANAMVNNVVEDGVIVLHTGWDTLISGNVITNGSMTIHTASRRVNVTNNVIYNGNLVLRGGLSGIEYETERRSIGINATGNVITANGGAGINLVSLDDSTIDNNTINGGDLYGVLFTSLNRCSISGNSIKDSVTSGINQLDATADGESYFLNICENIINGQPDRGIEFKRCVLSKVSGNIIRSGDKGVLIENDCSRIHVNGNTFASMAGNCVQTDATETVINGNIGTSYGNNFVYLGNGATNATVIQNKSTFGARFLQLQSSSVTGALVKDNVFTETVSGIQSDTVMIGNTGYVTEASGVGTVANGTTSISITHNLDRTPTAKDIMVTPTNNLGSASKFWISNIDASTFDINVDSDPGVSTATFSWCAEIK